MQLGMRYYATYGMARAAGAVSGSSCSRQCSGARRP